jgi:hypothetical protein
VLTASRAVQANVQMRSMWDLLYFG